MNRSLGFSLIEMMIVVVVMNIVMASIFQPIQQLVSWWHRGDIEFQRQEAITTGFTILQKAFSQAVEVRWRSDDEVTCLGVENITIRRVKRGRMLEIQKGKGLIRLDFYGGAFFGPFKPVDDKTVWGGILVNGAKIPMFWRCGK